MTTRKKEEMRLGPNSKEFQVDPRICRKFYVIQFKEARVPKNAIGKYHCLPLPWVIVINPSSSDVYVWYPDMESAGKAKILAKNGTKPPTSWGIYEASVKHMADTYKDGQKWIAAKMKNDVPQLTGTQSAPFNKQPVSANNIEPESDKDVLNKAYSITTNGDSIKQPDSGLITFMHGLGMSQLELCQSSIIKQQVTANDNTSASMELSDDVSDANERANISGQPNITLERKTAASRVSAKKQSIKIPAEEKTQPKIISDDEEIVNLVDLDESAEDVDIDTDVERMPAVERPLSKTSLNTLEVSYQPQFMYDRSISNVQAQSSASYKGLPFKSNGGQLYHHHRSVFSYPSFVTTQPEQLNIQTGIPYAQFQPLDTNGSSTQEIQLRGRQHSQGQNVTPAISEVSLPKPTRKRSPPKVRTTLFKKPRTDSIGEESNVQNPDYLILHPGNTILTPLPSYIDLMGDLAEQTCQTLPVQSIVTQNYSKPLSAQQSGKFTVLKNSMQSVFITNHLQSLVPSTYNHHAYVPAEFILQSRATPTSQPSQVLPQINDRNLSPNTYVREIISHELLKGPIDDNICQKTNNKNVGKNIKLAAHNVRVRSMSNQLYSIPGNSQNPDQQIELHSVLYNPHGPIAAQPTLLLVSNPATNNCTATNATDLVHPNPKKIHILHEQRIPARFNQNYNENLPLNLINVAEDLNLSSVVNPDDLGTQMTLNSQRNILLHNQRTQASFNQNQPLDLSVMPLNLTTRPINLTQTDLSLEQSHTRISVCDKAIQTEFKLISAKPQQRVDSECQTDDTLLEDRTPSCPNTSNLDIDEDQGVASDYASDCDNTIEHSDIEIISSNRRSAAANLSEKNEPENHVSIDRIMATIHNWNIETEKMQDAINSSTPLELFQQLEMKKFGISRGLALLKNKTKFISNSKTKDLQFKVPKTPTSPTTQQTKSIPGANTDRNPDVTQPSASVINNKNSEKNSKEKIINSFTLPPEYDPDDSKWTLKHRESKPGLVELIPKSGVYVEETKLKGCEKKSRKCKELAASVLTEVFSINALRVCSLTGKEAMAYRSTSRGVRPGLDEYALLTLMTYIEQYANNRSWGFKMPEITSAIRWKVNYIRSKHENKMKSQLGVI